MLGAYQLVFETKFIRRIHKVRISPRFQAKEIKEAFLKVPDTAQIKDTGYIDGDDFEFTFAEEIEEK